jgi:hypothetical protein
MTIQTTVPSVLVSGVVGELAFDGPNRILTAVLDTGSATNNFIGRVVTWADQTAGTVKVGGATGFAGILMHPKSMAQPLLLTDNGAIADGQTVQVLFMGELYVAVPTDAAAIGAALVYDAVTGAIEVGAPAEGKIAIPTGVVSRHVGSTNTGASLIVARLTN